MSSKTGELRRSPPLAPHVLAIACFLWPRYASERKRSTVVGHDRNFQGSQTKDHTCTHVVLVNALRTLLFRSEPWGGRVHAKPMTDATPSPSLARWEPVGAGARLPGVHAAKVAILMPAQAPCGQELPWAPQRAIQALLDRRLRIAHVTAASSAVVSSQPHPPVEGGRPRCRNGHLRCAAQHPVAPNPGLSMVASHSTHTKRALVLCLHAPLAVRSLSLGRFPHGEGIYTPGFLKVPMPWGDLRAALRPAACLRAPAALEAPQSASCCP